MVLHPAWLRLPPVLEQPVHNGEDVERATVSSQASSQHLLEAGANSVI